MTPSEAFKRFRKEFGLTQEQAGTMLGATGNAFAKYERTKRATPPEGRALIKMALTFKVSTDYLLGLTDDPRPANIVWQELDSEKKEKE